MEFVMINKKVNTHLLHFTVADILLCLNVLQIKIIILLPQLIKVPNTIASLIGLLNLSGKSVPVIDLAVELNLPRKSSYTTNNPIIICQNENKFIGLLVDEIVTLARHDELQANLAQVQTKDSYYQASINYNNVFSLMLNLKNIYAHTELFSEKSVNG